MDKREKLPPREWQPIPTPFAIRSASIGASSWMLGRVAVISTLVDADLPDGSGETGPQWHVSISASGKRAKPTEIRKALRAFGMVGAEEDNHHPGAARHFWMPVDPKRRVACECKATEVQVVDSEGYRWSNDAESCRGCDLERVMAKIGRVRPCPIHRNDEARR